jgi:hypothetical protein
VTSNASTATSTKPSVNEHPIEIHADAQECTNDPTLSQHHSEMAFLRQYFMKFVLSFYILKVITLENNHDNRSSQTSNGTLDPSTIYSRASSSTELYVRICTAMASRAQVISSYQTQPNNTLLPNIYNLSTYLAEFREVTHTLSAVFTFTLSTSKFPVPSVKMKSAAYRTLRLVLLSCKYFTDTSATSAHNSEAPLATNSPVQHFINFLLRSIECDLVQMCCLDNSKAANVSSLQLKLHELQPDVRNLHLNWLELIHLQNTTSSTGDQFSFSPLQSNSDGTNISPNNHRSILKYIAFPAAEIISVLDRFDESLTGNTSQENMKQPQIKQLNELAKIATITREHSRDLLSSIFNCLEYLFRSPTIILENLFTNSLSNNTTNPVTIITANKTSHIDMCIDWCIGRLHPLLLSMNNLSYQYMFNQWLIKLSPFLASLISSTHPKYLQLQTLKFNINIQK